MGSNTAVIKEIVRRLTRDSGEGLPLESVKRIFVGSQEEVRNQENFPVIMIKIDYVEESRYSPNRLIRDEMHVNVHLFHNKLEGDNTLFSEDESEGSLKMLESILNSIDLDDNGNADKTLGQSIEKLPTIRYYVYEASDIVEIRIEYTLTTKTVAIGNR